MKIFEVTQKIAATICPTSADRVRNLCGGQSRMRLAGNEKA